MATTCPSELLISTSITSQKKDCTQQGRPRLSLAVLSDDTCALPVNGSDQESGSKRHVEQSDPPKSPSKKGRLQEYFIGQDSEEELISPSLVQKACRDFFERNIAPIIQSLQESHAKLDAQIQQIKVDIEKDVMDATFKLPRSAMIRAEDPRNISNEIRIKLRGGEAETTDRLQLESEGGALASVMADIQNISEKIRVELRESQKEQFRKLQSELEVSGAQALQSESELRGVVKMLGDDLGRIREQLRQLPLDLLVGETWPGRRLTSSLLGSDVTSDVGSFTGSLAESATSSMVGQLREERNERRRRPLPQVGTSGRARLAAMRQRRQEGRAPFASCLAAEATSEVVLPHPAI